MIVGLAIPAVVIGLNSANHAENGPNGVDLTAAEAHGRQLFAQNCSTCHTLSASNAVGKVGPNLDELNGGDLPPAFVLDAIHNGRARGNGQMPAGLLAGQRRQGRRRLRVEGRRPLTRAARADSRRTPPRRPVKGRSVSSRTVADGPLRQVKGVAATKCRTLRRGSVRCVPDDAQLALAITLRSSRDFRRCYDAAVHNR